MKKQFLLLAALALTTFAFAQNKPSFGFRGGVTHAGMQGDAVNSLKGLLSFADGVVSTNGRTGFFGGGYASIPVGSRFSIEPGLYYTQKGYALQGSYAVKNAEFLSANARARLNTSYLDLPLLAKVNLNGFQVFAGPQASYLLDAKLRTTAGALGFNVLDKTMDAKSQFNDWDFGLTGGIGYQFGNGFSVTAAYDHGLSRVDNGQSFDSYNRVVKVGLGFRL